MFKTQFLGRLGRNAQVFESANGVKFVGFTVAVNTRNQGKDVTYWIDVRSFNPNHVRLSQYLTKGKIVQIGGDINTGMMTDKLGVVRITHNVIADYITFINLGNGNKSDREETTNDSNEIHEATAPQTDNIVETKPKVAKSDDDGITMGNTPSVPQPVAEAVGVGAGSDDDDELPF